MNTKSKTWYGIKDLEKRPGRLTFKDILKSTRLSMELSQKSFAKKIGISNANLCDIEKGRKGVSPQKAARLAKILGYSIDLWVQTSIQDQLSAAGLHYRVSLEKSA